MEPLLRFRQIGTFCSFLHKTPVKHVPVRGFVDKAVTFQKNKGFPDCFSRSATGIHDMERILPVGTDPNKNRSFGMSGAMGSLINKDYQDWLYLIGRGWI